MSLFKQNILSQYNILGVEEGILYLHCSRNDFIKAPFNGKLNKDGILSGNGKTVKFHNVTLLSDKIGKVKAGEAIAMPIMKKYKGSNIAFIGLEVRSKGVQEDALKYLDKEDIDEPKKKKIEE